VNVWLIGATILLLAVFPCGWIVARARLLEALVAIELIATVLTVVLLLIAEGYHRNSYFTLPLVLAFANVIGGLVLLRFAGRVSGDDGS
jgi:multisubunit Na+/H+ antiporter MnhF subunit